MLELKNNLTQMKNVLDGLEGVLTETSQTRK